MEPGTAFVLASGFFIALGFMVATLFAYLLFTRSDPPEG